MGPWDHGADGWPATVLALRVGATVVPMQFGFYKQWIRFHVTKDALTST